MSPGSSTESYPAFARIGLRENLNQVTCPDRDSNPGHLVSQPYALTVTPQYRYFKLKFYNKDRNTSLNFKALVFLNRRMRDARCEARLAQIRTTEERILSIIFFFFFCFFFFFIYHKGPEILDAGILKLLKLVSTAHIYCNIRFLDSRLDDKSFSTE
ncbi:hypothetical protein ANN_17358 [Periplaneta americana]|uniref:Uncharacterized protein n=1 Tax=Periplaneta americana TaxID=6978 RepID=A0ABQ8STN6_PERAM|nr:hypothetical protein ANN_17358 [Periplaneta americana]